MRRNEDRLPVQRGKDWSPARTGEMDLFNPASFFSPSPWPAMRRMQEDLDRLFSQFFSEMPEASSRSALQQWRPNVDISQDEKEWCIEADLPGVNPDNIDVRVQDHHLILRAELRSESESEEEGKPKSREYHQRERRYGYFERILPLPQNVDEEHIGCDFKNGVLTIHLPRQEEATPAARRIPITSGDAGGKGATASLPKQEAGQKSGQQAAPQPAQEKKAA